MISIQGASRGWVDTYVKVQSSCTRLITSRVFFVSIDRSIILQIVFLLLCVATKIQYWSINYENQTKRCGSCFYSRGTVHSVCLSKKLGALAILESASFTHGRDRYSLILAREAFRVVQNNRGVFYSIENQLLPFCSGDILDALLEIAGQNALPPDGIPLPGAGIGYLGYDFANE